MATPVPRALALPDGFVPESAKGIHGKGFLLCLELLEITTSGSAFANQQARRLSNLIDLVNVEGGSFRKPLSVLCFWVLPKETTKDRCFLLALFLAIAIVDSSAYKLR